MRLTDKFDFYAHRDILLESSSANLTADVIIESVIDSSRRYMAAIVGVS